MKSSECHQNMNNKPQCHLEIHPRSKLLTSLASWEALGFGTMIHSFSCPGLSALHSAVGQCR